MYSLVLCDPNYSLLRPSVQIKAFTLMYLFFVYCPEFANKQFLVYFKYERCDKEQTNLEILFSNILL